MAMFAENLENLDMIRTPLKAKNQEFTPALGKRQATKTMFGTPNKRLLTATPRSVLGNKNCHMTPCAFKKPIMTPTVKMPLMTPKRTGFSKAINDSTPSKFAIYEDKDENLVKEMKRKHFTIDQPERCPWANKNDLKESVDPEPPSLEIIDDYQYSEPTKKKIKPLSIDVLPLDSALKHESLADDFSLLDLPQLPEFPEGEEVELCPWALPDQQVPDKSSAKLELELSTLSDVDVTKESISEISIRCFNDSYQQLYDALSDDDELPDIPSTPDLDRQLAELLEMSFDNLIL